MKNWTCTDTAAARGFGLLEEGQLFDRHIFNFLSISFFCKLFSSERHQSDNTKQYVMRLEMLTRKACYRKMVSLTSTTANESR